MTDLELMTTQLDHVLHEKEVMDRWGKLFAERELAEARKAGTIEFYDLRKGPHYTPGQLIAYLQSKRKFAACNKPLDPDKPVPASDAPNGSFKSETSGSSARQSRQSSSIVGMTPELEERAARQLEYET